MLREIHDPITGAPVLTIRGRATGGHTYHCIAGVCSDARCPRTTLTLTLVPLTESKTTRNAVHAEITLDPIYRCQAELVDAPTAVTDYGRLVARELDEEDWAILLRVFLREKQAYINAFDAAESPYPFAFDRLEREGLAVPYTQVFPFGEQFVFSHDGARYSVRDEYCLHPWCPCPEVAMSIFRGDPYDIDAPLVDRFSRNVETKIWTHIASRRRPRRRDRPMLEAFVAAHPDLDIIYAARRLQLREVYADSKARLGNPERVLPSRVP